MKNIRLGIYETVELYGKRLAGYISGLPRSPFIVSLYLEHPAREPEQACDVMIVTSSLWPLYKGDGGELPVLVLDEDGRMPQSENCLILYKYQSAAAIYEALTDLCLNAGRWRMTLGDTGKKPLQVWGIFTPSRCKETVRDVENYLAAVGSQAKTLRISLEPVYSGQVPADGSDGSFSDVIYFLKQNKTGLGSRMTMMAREGPCDLILPAPVYSEVMDLKTGEWEQLITALNEETEYGQVIFDFGSGPVPEALFGCLTHMKVLHRDEAWENEIAARVCQMLRAFEDPEKDSVIEDTLIEI